MTELKINGTADRAEQPEVKISETIEEYCEAIYNLTADGEGPVKSVHLADRMGVAAATVFATIQRMQKSGLVMVDPHSHHIKLTETGEGIALKLARRHSLLERFLLDHLGLRWDEVHAEACEMEHVLSTGVEEALNRYLGYPATCPHGNVIPGNGHVCPGDSRPLDQVEPGHRVKIVRVSEEGEHQAGLLRYLFQQGLVPGVHLEVKEKWTFDETITLVNNEQNEISLGRKTAHALWVSEETSEPAPEK
ncbi:MAG: metal-dependent transcriptional regulator [Chloroflexi bacterium]|nr:metal-dependent transcriptional regulator [Chloroflexota bacterium]